MQSNAHSDHSAAVEDYLRAIFNLSGDKLGQRVTTSQLAERLAVRPASVTSMLQKLAAATPALVDYHKSHGACLTLEGQQAALGVVRCHRLLELFLHEKLGFGWDEVHDEADRLEHAISAATVDRIAEALGHPTHDPHGHAIPDADLTLEPATGISLANCATGAAAAVRYVRDEDADLLRYLDAIGLRPGEPVVVARREIENDLLWVRVGDGVPVPIGLLAATQIFVRPRSA
jgi:DtxR family Mn-dependent transcriptional regulator